MDFCDGRLPEGEGQTKLKALEGMPLLASPTLIMGHTCLCDSQGPNPFSPPEPSDLLLCGTPTHNSANAFVPPRPVALTLEITFSANRTARQAGLLPSQSTYSLMPCNLIFHWTAFLCIDLGSKMTQLVPVFFITIVIIISVLNPVLGTQ